jgi:hypothetical protein
MRSKLFCCLLSFLFLGTACNKKSSEATTSAAPQPAPAAAPTPAPPVTAPASAPADAVASGPSVETTAKMAAADWAIKQDEIKNDPHGQWAISAAASSVYNKAKGNAAYSANQVTGPPNVDKYGDAPSAWAPATTDAGIEWLDLKYAKPVYATGVSIRESYGSGAVIKVELFDEQGGAHTAWAGNDPTTELNYLLVKIPKTAYKTARVKVTLATNVIPGWNEIDAVQLVGSDQ